MRMENMMHEKLFKKMFNACVEIVSKSGDLTSKTGRSQVACAIVGESGKIHTGLNIGWWHSSCAEVTALSNAWKAGERTMQYMMAVKLNKRNGNIESLTPCGICREMFKYLHPEIKVVYIENNNFVVKTIGEMLPDIINPPKEHISVPKH